MLHLMKCFVTTWTLRGKAGNATVFPDWLDKVHLCETQYLAQLTWKTCKLWGFAHQNIGSDV